MKLFFSNQQFQMKKDSPAAKRVKTWLDSQKNGELFGRFQIFSACDICESTLDASRPMLTGYFHKHKGKLYYGNKATITHFKKEIEKHGNS